MNLLKDIRHFFKIQDKFSTNFDFILEKFERLSNVEELTDEVVMNDEFVIVDKKGFFKRSPKTVGKTLLASDLTPKSAGLGSTVSSIQENETNGNHGNKPVESGTTSDNDVEKVKTSESSLCYNGIIIKRLLDLNQSYGLDDLVDPSDAESLSSSTSSETGDSDDEDDGESEELPLEEIDNLHDTPVSVECISDSGDGDKGDTNEAGETPKHHGNSQRGRILKIVDAPVPFEDVHGDQGRVIIQPRGQRSDIKVADHFFEVPCQNESIHCIFGNCQCGGRTEPFNLAKENVSTTHEHHSLTSSTTTTDGVLDLTKKKLSGSSRDTSEVSSKTLTPFLNKISTNRISSMAQPVVTVQPKTARRIFTNLLSTVDNTPPRSIAMESQNVSPRGMLENICDNKVEESYLTGTTNVGVKTTVDNENKMPFTVRNLNKISYEDPDHTKHSSADQPMKLENKIQFSKMIFDWTAADPITIDLSKCQSDSNGDKSWLGRGIAIPNVVYIDQEVRLVKSERDCDNFSYNRSTRTPKVFLNERPVVLDSISDRRINLMATAKLDEGGSNFGSGNGASKKCINGDGGRKLDTTPLDHQLSRSSSDEKVAIKRRESFYRSRDRFMKSKFSAKSFLAEMMIKSVPRLNGKSLVINDNTFKSINQHNQRNFNRNNYKSPEVDPITSSTPGGHTTKSESKLGNVPSKIKLASEDLSPLKSDRSSGKINKQSLDKNKVESSNVEREFPKITNDEEVAKERRKAFYAASAQFCKSGGKVKTETQISKSIAQNSTTSRPDLSTTEDIGNCSLVDDDSDLLDKEVSSTFTSKIYTFKPRCLNFNDIRSTDESSLGRMNVSGYISGGKTARTTGWSLGDWCQNVSRAESLTNPPPIVLIDLTKIEVEEDCLTTEGDETMNSTYIGEVEGPNREENSSDIFDLSNYSDNLYQLTRKGKRKRSSEIPRKNLNLRNRTHSYSYRAKINRYASEKGLLKHDNGNNRYQGDEPVASGGVVAHGNSDGNCTFITGSSPRKKRLRSESYTFSSENESNCPVSPPPRSRVGDPKRVRKPPTRLSGDFYISSNDNRRTSYCNNLATKK